MIKKIYAGLAAVFILLAGYSYAKAAERTTWSPGGGVVDFIEKYNALRVAEGKMTIDGPCVSACTLFLGLLNKDQVCATPFGLLAFHSASLVNQLTGERKHSSEGTRLIWNIYPSEVRDVLRSKGWDADKPDLEEHPDLIFIPAVELVRPCDAASEPR